MSMTQLTGDYQKLFEQKRFLGEIEQGIRIANREIIHQNIPDLTRDAVLAFAISVARLRARYLETAFKLGMNEHGDPFDQADITELKSRREAFEEAREAFEALRQAIERGYVEVQLD